MKSLENDNSFIDLRESAQGRVSVKLHASNLVKDSDSEQYYGKVARVTYTNQNILDMMADELPDISVGKITDVMTAYTTIIQRILALGGAARFGNLGTFYIAAKGLTDSQTGKPSLTVRFTADELLLNAAQNVTITESSLSEPKVTVDRIADVARNASDGTLTGGSSVAIKGSGLRIFGRDSGVWCAPTDGDGNCTTDTAQWKEVDGPFFYNTPSKLLFTLPQGLAPDGSYCFVLRTRCLGYSKRERKSLIQTVTQSFKVTA